MGKAVDGVQAVVVARGTIAIGHHELLGAELYQAKGRGGTGKVAALEAVGVYLARSYEWINILGNPIGLLGHEG